MKLCVVLLAILYLVNARNIENSENEKHRHRRRSRDPYGYVYDYDRDDSITEIKHLLQEISSYVKRPPTPLYPPQIIYVPYPVPYPCNPNNISVGNRIEIPEDDNMIWGINMNTGYKGSNIDKEGDGSRPISLDPIEPSDNFPEMPPVQHGSNQAGMTTTTTPSPTKSPAQKSRICQAAILICCNNSDEEKRKQCFFQYDCLRTYFTGVSCHKAVIDKAFEEFTNAFGPR